jgi:hypothetical protein
MPNFGKIDPKKAKARANPGFPSNARREPAAKQDA